ncbi:MAG: hypothetical protein ACPHJ3_04795 [Rubripirellula sp.]
MSWIMLRNELRTHPKVVTLMSRMSVTMSHTIGLLSHAWMMADEHADENGVIHASKQTIDVLVEMPGFADEMESVGWLKSWVDEDGEWTQFVDYQQHNGSTSKSRAQGNKRKQKQRKRACHGDVTQVRDTSVTREEKSTLYDNPPTPLTPTPKLQATSGFSPAGFDEFVCAFDHPDGKVNMHAARIAYATAVEDLEREGAKAPRLTLKRGAERWRRFANTLPEDDRTRRLLAKTWLENRRWEDELDDPQGRAERSAESVATRTAENNHKQNILQQYVVRDLVDEFGHSYHGQRVPLLCDHKRLAEEHPQLFAEAIEAGMEIILLQSANELDRIRTDLQKLHPREGGGSRTGLVEA